MRETDSAEALSVCVDVHETQLCCFKCCAHRDYEMRHQGIVEAAGTDDSDLIVYHIKRVQLCHRMKFTDSLL